MFPTRGAVLDLKAVDRRGCWYNIEVQLQAMEGRENYFKRSLFYWTKLFSAQLEPGNQYSKLEKTISISLLDFYLFRDTEELHSTYCIKEKTSNKPFLDMLELHYIELRKFSIHKPHNLRTPFERWLHILKFSELYAKPGTELPENLREEEGISMAIETMRKAYARDEVRELIQMREKARLDYESGLATAHERGLEKGREEGREEGLEKGLERGREEVARRMLARQTDRAFILEVTGLSEEELAALEQTSSGSSS